MLGPLMLLLQVAANAQLGYRLTLPEGFTDFPAGTQKDVVACWTEVTPASPSGALILCIQRMRGTLGREHIRPEDIPAPSQLVSFKWKGFDIDGLRTDTAQGGIQFVVFAAQVPLRREAVQLIVAGPRDQAARAQAIMTSSLAGLEGETNWLTEAERAGRLGNVVGLVIAVGVALIALRIWRARRR
jgi:hypothetical protein